MTTLARETTIALTPPMLGLAARDIHKAVMACISSDSLDPSSPRADARALWRRDAGALTVRRRPDLRLDVPGRLGAVLAARDIPASADGQRVDIDVLIARYWTPPARTPDDVRQLAAQVRAPGPSPRATKRCPVPVDRLDDWAAARLSTRGIAGVSDLVCESAPDVVMDNHRRGQRIPAARIRATVDGGAALNRILAEGIGHAKSYGLGLVVRADLNH